MQISEQQLVMLLDVLRHVIDSNVEGINFGYKRGALIQLYEDILTQQTKIITTQEE